MGRTFLALCAVAGVGLVAGCAMLPKFAAASIEVPMALATATGPGAPIGTIRISESPKGAVLKLDLRGLPPGDRGFHLHEGASCDPAPNAQGAIAPAMAARGHLDPAQTGKHEGPDGAGHLGDLPLIRVDADGRATQTLIAPRLTTLAAFRDRALVIHGGGDNYSDAPAPLGGGGPRIACGVVK
ncbi:MAG: superoxide dismutase family protein [Alphaproteobacteria bacterium]|nr:superoxide dismutase family protein [Alphaproteobacteria bacterium]